MPDDDETLDDGDILEQLGTGNGTRELAIFREKLRLVAAFALIFGLGADRFGPVIFEGYQPLGDVAFGIVLASALILLGERGLTPLIERFLK